MLSLSTTSLFKTFSCCWGEPTPTQHISLPSKTLGITENLHQLIRRLVELGIFNHLMWIGAICIDQSNLSERGHQVRLMQEIYSDAEDVVIWLGERIQNSGLAFIFSTSWLAPKLRCPLSLLRSSQATLDLVQILRHIVLTQRCAPSWNELNHLMERP